VPARFTLVAATLAVVAAVLFLDQSSKLLMQRAKLRQAMGGVVLRCVLNPASLRRRVLPKVTMTSIWVLALLSVGALHNSGHFHRLVSSVGIGMALGGAAGNLLDLWRWRGIRDFIEIGWWPVFNLADAGIVIGLLLAFLM